MKKSLLSIDITEAFVPDMNTSEENKRLVMLELSKYISDRIDDIGFLDKKHILTVAINLIVDTINISTEKDAKAFSKEIVFIINKWENNNDTNKT